MAIFIPKPWVNRFGIMSIFRLFQLLVFISQKGLSSFQNIVKDIFPGLFCLKKKIRKMAIFIPKPWVNPFGKISIFRLFQLRAFLSQKGLYSFQNIVKHFFLAYFGQKKKLEILPFSYQNHGLTPQEKCQFFDCFNFLFSYPRKPFIRSRIS